MPVYSRNPIGKAGGDLSGSDYPNPSVSKIQNIQIDLTGISNGQILGYNGTKVVPVTSNPGDITSVTAGTNLTGGGTSGGVTVNLTSSITGGLDVISGLGSLTSSNAFFHALTVTGSVALGDSNSDSVTIQNMPLQISGATLGQALSWDGTKYAPATISAVLTGPAGGVLTGSYPNPIGLKATEEYITLYPSPQESRDIYLVSAKADLSGTNLHISPSSGLFEYSTANGNLILEAGWDGSGIDGYISLTSWADNIKLKTNDAIELTGSSGEIKLLTNDNLNISSSGEIKLLTNDNLNISSSGTARISAEGNLELSSKGTATLETTATGSLTAIVATGSNSSIYLLASASLYGYSAVDSSIIAVSNNNISGNTVNLQATTLNISGAANTHLNGNSLQITASNFDLSGSTLDFIGNNIQITGSSLYKVSGSSINLITKDFFVGDSRRKVIIDVFEQTALKLSSSNDIQFDCQSFYSYGDTILRDTRPYSDVLYDLGTVNFRWGNIYATNGTIQTSDRNEKTEITSSLLGLSFIEELKPVSFKRTNGVRTHYGLIAQDVEETILDNNLTTQDFAGLVIGETTDIDGKTIKKYGLRYEEFISPLIKAVQELSAKVKELEAKLSGSK